MSKVQFDEESVFQRARALSDPEERAAYLGRACPDADARARVEALLGVPASFLDVPAGPPAVTETAGAVIGPYKLLERLGEGGLGVVFMAEQTEPVRRRVALKVIKPGMDTRQVVARFEAERQALALMDHPNIARVLDGGSTASGRPYFVMELVRGVSITEYADTHDLPVAERLALFVDVCQAVQHAHQKGIIHRDLKPSNVLVASYDGRPVVKVIDFGVAKATGQQLLTDKTLFTGFAQMIGTPLYMSPEQAEFSGLDVDTRSDIYALGVLLYELLTGTTPFDRGRLRDAAFDEVRRILREETAPTPSARISTLGETLPQVSARRRSDPRQLVDIVRGDLDWIVMRCLEKERSRRYETASGLASDVRRYLRHEPVAAGPPSARYRLRKFVRRHRARVVAIALITLSLLAGIVGVTIGFVRARRAQIAEAAEKRVAQERLEQLRWTLDSMSSIFGDLNPRLGPTGGDVPLAHRLGRRLALVAERIDPERVGDAETAARLLNNLGDSQRFLGFANQAIATLERARELYASTVGPHDPATLLVCSNLALAFGDAGRFDRSVVLLEDIVPRLREALGPRDSLTLVAMNNLALSYARLDRTHESIRVYETVLAARQEALPSDHVELLRTAEELGYVYTEAREFERGLSMLERVLERRRTTLGPDHPDTVMSLVKLGTALRDAGRPERGVPLLEEALATARRRFGPHAKTLVAMNNLALVYDSLGELDKAGALLEEAARLTREHLGPDHPSTLRTTANFALNLRERGRSDEAIRLLEDTLELARRRPGPLAPETVDVYTHLGYTYELAGRPEDAVRIYRELHPRQEGLPAGGTLGAIGRALRAQGKHAEAEAPLRGALRFLEGALDDYRRFAAMSELGECLQALGRGDEAAPLLEQGYAGIQKDIARIPPDRLRFVVDALDRVVRLRVAGEGADAAAAWRAREIETLRAMPGPTGAALRRLLDPG